MLGRFFSAPRILKWLAFGQLVVGVGTLGVLIWVLCDVKGWTHAGTDVDYRRAALVLNALGTLSLAVAALGAVGALLATTAPRLLSMLHLGPQLDLDWLGSGFKYDYYHPWDRDFGKDPSDGKERKSKAVIVRLGVKNAGYIGAESVECTIERLCADNKDAFVKTFKQDSLRWAHSWEREIEDINVGQAHRNTSTIWPLISPDTTQFLDLGFIFQPGSEFYRRLRLVPHSSIIGDQLYIDQPQFWCFHLCSRWIPSPNCVLVPTSETRDFYLFLRLSAKNSHSVAKCVKVSLGPLSSLKEEHFNQSKNTVVGRIQGLFGLLPRMLLPMQQ